MPCCCRTDTLLCVLPHSLPRPAPPRRPSTGSKDGLVKLWCPKSGRCLATLHGHKATIMQARCAAPCCAVLQVQERVCLAAWATRPPPCRRVALCRGVVASQRGGRPLGRVRKRPPGATVSPALPDCPPRRYLQTEWNGNGNWVLTASRDQTCKVGGEGWGAGGRGAGILAGRGAPRPPAWHAGWRALWRATVSAPGRLATDPVRCPAPPAGRLAHP